MRLTDRHIDDCDRDGFIVLSDLFSDQEVALLQRDAEMLRTPRRGHPDANLIEKDGTSIRAAWAVEMDAQACAAACRLPRVLGPVRQLLADDAYLYQSRLNYKVTGKGDVFQWRQDYTSWHMDGMPHGGHRDLLTVLIMLDDTNTENGPLRFLPGLHREGMIEPVYDTRTTSYPLHVVPEPKVASLAVQSGIVECTGPAGTVAIFCGNLCTARPRTGRTATAATSTLPIAAAAIDQCPAVRGARIPTTTS